MIREVLTEAVEGGGTASEDYADVGGAVGRYRPQVYDRGGEPCAVCGTPLTRIRLGGRGTVFCARCQAPGPARKKKAKSGATAARVAASIA